METTDILKIIVEAIGYLGMAFVILSFLMKGMKLLRIFNIIGGLLCLAYGIITKTYPTAVLNLILVCVNMSFPIRFYIISKKKEKEEKADE